MIENKTMTSVSQGVQVEEKAGKGGESWCPGKEGLRWRIREVIIVAFTMMSQAISLKAGVSKCWLLSI